MRRRLSTTVAAVGLLAGALLAAGPPEGFEYVPTSERVYNAIGCITGADGATCQTTTYELSTGPGTNSVASTNTATPVASAVYYVDGVYLTQTYSPGAGVKGESYIVDASRPLTGQVTLRGYGGVHASADAAVFVELSLRHTTAAGKAVTTRLSAEVEKPAMTPVDNVFAYEIDIPDALHEVTVTVSGMAVGQRGIHVLTSGFTDGQGGSYFTLPTFDLVESA